MLDRHIVYEVCYLNNNYYCMSGGGIQRMPLVFVFKSVTGANNIVLLAEHSH